MNLKELNIMDHGVEILEGLLSNDDMQLVINEIEKQETYMPKCGIRNAEKKFSSISRIVSNDVLFEQAKCILGVEPQVVRVIFFDKTPDKNWLVTWHQDKTIALNKKVAIEGWGPWSLKDGVHHVQPAVDVLDEMVTLRLHLDAADERNGCLKIIPASHKRGIMKQNEIDEIVSSEESVLCKVNAGDAIAMRPHILHSSSKSIVPEHRRVIHIEYCGHDLPEGVSWAS